MIDLHAHLLPGVDDGPSSWEEALGIVRLASAEGIRAMAATSHMMAGGAFDNTRAELLPLIEELRMRVERAGLDVTIHVGGEVYMTPDVVKRYEQGELLTYCDAGRYMLLEMPSGEIPRYAFDVIFELKLLGITPIIAHPERNHDIMDKPSRAFELVEQGALMQVNASSLASGRPVQRTARYLLQHRLAHFLATDAHGMFTRRPRLRKYLRRASEWAGAEDVERMVRDNPAAVLSGEAIEPMLPKRYKNPLPTSWLGNFARRLTRGNGG